MVPANAILLTASENDTWTEQLRAAVGFLGGDLSVVRERELPEARWGDYDIVVLSASGINNLALVISEIRSRSPGAKIVVFSSSPTWIQAREAIRAGAVDYAPKKLEFSKILYTLKNGLEVLAPPPNAPE